jgi:hypothetical protein
MKAVCNSSRSTCNTKTISRACIPCMSWLVKLLMG